MCKDIIISVLAALLAMEWVPWTEGLTAWQRVSVGAGWASTLIIFCLFCDQCAEKWRKRRRRVAGVRATVDKLLERGKKVD